MPEKNWTIARMISFIFAFFERLSSCNHSPPPKPPSTSLHLQKENERPAVQAVRGRMAESSPQSGTLRWLSGCVNGSPYFLMQFSHSLTSLLISMSSCSRTSQCA